MRPFEDAGSMIKDIFADQLPFRDAGRLSRQIYRYNHVSPADFYVSSGVHSVNEALVRSSLEPGLLSSLFASPD